MGAPPRAVALRPRQSRRTAGARSLRRRSGGRRPWRTGARRAPSGPFRARLSPRVLSPSSPAPAPEDPSFPPLSLAPSPPHCASPCSADLSPRPSPSCLPPFPGSSIAASPPPPTHPTPTTTTQPPCFRTSLVLSPSRRRWPVATAPVAYHRATPTPVPHESLSLRRLSVFLVAPPPLPLTPDTPSCRVWGGGALHLCRRCCRSALLPTDRVFPDTP